MSYPVVLESQSANVVSQNLDDSAAISTKKVIDIGSRCLKASNSRWHFGDSAIPVVGLIVGLIGIVLQAYATVRDKGKPKWLRALSLVGLSLTAALTLTTFVISMQFPPMALVLSFITIGLGLAMQTVEFFNSVVSVVKAKFNVLFPKPKEVSCDIARLNAKYAMLFKQQTALIYELNHEGDENKRQALQKRLSVVQKQLIKTQKARHKLQHPHETANKTYLKAKKSFKGASFGMGISLGSSVLAVIGLTLAVGNPPLGLALIGFGFLFDVVVLSRKLNKWCRERAKEKTKRQAFTHQRVVLINKSVKALKKERRVLKQSFTRVTQELTTKHTRASNDQKFLHPKPVKVRIKPLSKVTHIKRFFSHTEAANNDFIESLTANNNLITNKG